MNKPYSRIAAAIALLILASSARAAEPLRFEVSFDKSVREKPFTGRVLVLLGEPDSQPRFGPSWFGPKPFFAVDVKDVKPDQPIILDDRAVSYPAPMSKTPDGKYAAQAVIDLDPTSHDIGNHPGNAFSKPVMVEVGTNTPAVVKLRVDTLVPDRPFRESERVKLVDIQSGLLTQFHHRPVHLRAGVVLPDGYDKEPNRKWPVVYIIPGFGGSHTMAQAMANPGFPLPPGPIPAIQVVLDPDAPTGHHVFADSANNGPVGKALTTELIPHIEKTYRAVGKPYARFLTGHSSGGWSSLWLQVAYPDFFGGTWSTSPDPVDFRDFQRIDIYAPGENMFTDRQGKPRPLARQGDQPVIFYKPFSDMETVLGHGGQLASFEAVFSPPGADGQPLNLWNRTTGAIDPAVAKAWEKYDINLVLERNWSTFGPKLKGKLHVITGGMDTFYLEGAVKLLKETLERVGSDAVVEVIPGKDHGSVLTRDLRDRIGREMMEKFRAHETGKQ
jgi:hypothetical protein